MQTIKSTEIEYLSIQHCTARLIRENKIYQLDGKNDKYLVAEVQRELGSDVFSDSVTRIARKIRVLRRR